MPPLKIFGVPHTMRSNTENHLFRTMDDKLTETNLYASYHGCWGIHTIKALRSVDLSDHLVFKNIVKEDDKPRGGIKFYYKHHSRNTTFEGILEPPTGYRTLAHLTAILATLDPTLGTEKKERTAAVGDILSGKVISISKHGVSVRVFPENPSGYQDAHVPADELDHRIGVDPIRAVKTGEMITGKVTYVGKNQIIMSRKAVLESMDKFSGPDKQGKFTWVGYFDDPGRETYIKTAIQDAARRLGRRESDRYVVSKTILTDALRAEVLKRYKATSVKFSPCFRHLISSGWMLKDADYYIVPIDSNHQELRAKPEPVTHFAARSEPLLKGGLGDSPSSLLIDLDALANPRAESPPEQHFEPESHPPQPESQESQESVQDVSEEPAATSSNMPDSVVQSSTVATNVPKSILEIDLKLLDEYDQKAQQLSKIRKDIKDAREQLELLVLIEQETQDWLDQHTHVQTHLDKLREIEQFLKSRTTRLGENA